MVMSLTRMLEFSVNPLPEMMMLALGATSDWLSVQGGSYHSHVDALGVNAVFDRNLDLLIQAARQVE